MSNYIFKRFGLSSEMKVLDIGCGIGGILKQFSKHSLGVDINEDVLKEARSEGHQTKCFNVEMVFPTGLPDMKELYGAFDVVWCTDFLVHLKNPYAFLHDCRNVMDNGSLLVIQIPQYTPLIPQSIKKTYVSPTHFYAFHDPTLSYLLESAGFTIIKKSGCVRALSDWLNALLEPFTQRFGSNIWILAKKNGDFVEKKGWK